MDIIYLALALAMDAFAVSTALGNTQAKNNYRSIAIKAIFWFGFFQSFLFFLGNILGLAIKIHFLIILKYISFIMLLGVAIKMFYEFLKGEDIQEISRKSILIIAILVSIDAFVTGVAFAYYEINLLHAIFSIFIVTCFLSLLGFVIAKHLKKLEIIERYSLLLSSIILFILAIEVFIK